MVIASPIGNLEITDNGNAITMVELTEKSVSDRDASALQRWCASQLNEYFEGRRTKFDVPVEFFGTDFQKNVWNALLNIPYGDTMTYGDIARITGNPKAARAVGGACNKNHMLIIVPCHRVVGAGDRLVGFACGIEIKKTLLEIEASNKMHEVHNV